ncbi:PilZ domain-containing protein [Inmirania thermothiophila]|uniref:Atypical PilZ domain-containing cyclic di-GMP receptor n=1 Tax=Inmirania thermothiophila TaxID=1750597 RepID=A0A3N1Y7X8_9GAMM|nr:PilZ domain-containing protein [Inmirania thermothiophila]ROR34924.1 atypical PilZ domain-containing cyclic di-GMP receptor [Inmirania thermothiophila]
MAGEPQEGLGAGVVHRARIPLRWRAAPDDAVPDAQTNARVLRLALALDEWPRRGEPADEPGADPALARIERRLDLILELMGLWLAREGGAPPPRAVAWRLDALRWEGDGRPAPGQRVFVELVLDPRLPAPLVLAGRAGGDGTVILEPAPPPVAELLERYLFRQHRRTVARARAGGAPAAPPGASDF